MEYNLKNRVLEKLLFPLIIAMIGGGILAYFRFFGIAPCPHYKSVEGFVSTKDGLPAVNAWVELTGERTGQTAKSDREGHFLLKNVRATDTLELAVNYRGDTLELFRAIDFCSGGETLQIKKIELLSFYEEYGKEKKSSKKGDHRPTGLREAIGASPVTLSGYVFDTNQSQLDSVKVIGPDGLTFTDENGSFEFVLKEGAPPTQDVKLEFILEGYEYFSNRYYELPKTDIIVKLKKSSDE
jgi:hypothetical protein